MDELQPHVVETGLPEIRQIWSRVNEIRGMMQSPVDYSTTLEQIVTSIEVLSASVQKISDALEELKVNEDETINEQSDEPGE